MRLKHLVLVALLLMVSQCTRLVEVEEKVENVIRDAA